MLTPSNIVPTGIAGSSPKAFTPQLLVFLPIIAAYQPGNTGRGGNLRARRHFYAPFTNQMLDAGPPIHVARRHSVSYGFMFEFLAIVESHLFIRAHARPLSVWVTNLWPQIIYAFGFSLRLWYFSRLRSLVFLFALGIYFYLGHFSSSQFVSRIFFAVGFCLHPVYQLSSIQNANTRNY